MENDEHNIDKILESVKKSANEYLNNIKDMKTVPPEVNFQ